MAYGRISLEQALNSENFYQLPKVLISSRYYRALKAEAKLMFMLCRDRLSASLDSTRKGDLRFVDEEGDVFIYYTVKELSEELGCSEKKVTRLKRELIKYGLIDEVRQGLNKANRIYIKNVLSDSSVLDSEFSPKSPENPENTRTRQNDLSRPDKMTVQETSNCRASKTKESETKESIYSSRKAGLDSTDSQEKSRGYIPPKYYSLLEVIADKYNGKFTQFDLFEGRFQHYTLTHKQKMLIGQYLTDQYVTSSEVLDMIDRIPYDCEKPLAYLLKMLENLKEERRIEEKIVAHRNANALYGGK